MSRDTVPLWVDSTNGSMPSSAKSTFVRLFLAELGSDASIRQHDTSDLTADVELSPDGGHSLVSIQLAGYGVVYLITDQDTSLVFYWPDRHAYGQWLNGNIYRVSVNYAMRWEHYSIYGQVVKRRQSDLYTNDVDVDLESETLLLCDEKHITVVDLWTGRKVRELDPKGLDLFHSTHYCMIEGQLRANAAMIEASCDEDTTAINWSW